MAERPPNILFIMSDDHAAHAMSCYGSRINVTPNLDRIATEGMRFDNCFCTNSICTPSRASILTGTYNHVNGATTLATPLDGRQQTFPKLLQAAGYQTAIIGKWHLGHGGIHDPQGFDFWTVLPDQGLYYNPHFLDRDGEHVYPAAMSPTSSPIAAWTGSAARPGPPVLACCATTKRRTVPGNLPSGTPTCTPIEDIPLPDTFDDDYSHRAHAAAAATMRIERDLNSTDLKAPVPPGLTPAEDKHWKYQRYIKDYLRCVASIDDNVGRLLDYLDAAGLARGHDRDLHLGPGLLPRRSRLVRQALHVRRIAADAVHHPLSARDRARHDQRQHDPQRRFRADFPRLRRTGSSRADAGNQLSAAAAW